MKRLRAVALLGALAMAAVAESAQPAPRNLLVQIRIDRDAGRRGTSIGTGNVAGKVYSSAQSGSQDSIQQLTVLEGHEARFSVGQSVVLPLYQVSTGVNGTTFSQTALLRDVGSGFTVTPKLKGDRVIAEISVRHDIATADPLATNVDRLSTTVAGRLGEWIPVGASRQQDGQPQTDGVTYGTNLGGSDRQLWLKVDPAP